MVEHNSISQACTIIWPSEPSSSQTSVPVKKSTSGSSKKRKRNAVSSVTSNPTPLGEFERILASEPDILIDTRKQLFQSNFNAIESLLAKSCASIHESSLSELQKFVVEKACSSDDLLPTALLMLGMGGVDDSGRLYEKIISMLGSECQGIVVARALECSSLKKLIMDIIEQVVVDDDNDVVLRTKYDLNVLADWYNSLGESRPTSIVIMLPEIESCDPNVLQDFISILRDYSLKIPLVLVMGLATSFETFNQIISKKVMSLMDLEAFRFEQPKASLIAILDEIFLKNYKGPIINLNCMKLLIDNYFLHDQSLSSFIKSVKYSLMEFFYGNPLSVLFDPNSLDSLTFDHAENMRSLGSFKKFIESRLNSDQKDRVLGYLKDDNELKSLLPSLVTFITDYRIRFHGAFETLMILQRYITSSTLRKDRFDLLVLFMQPKLKQKEYLETVRCIVKLLKKSSLEAFAADIGALWSGKPEWKNMFASTLERIQLLLFTAGDGEGALSTENEREKARGLCQILDPFFQKYLISFDSLPLHEVFYPDTSKGLFKAFHPQIRSILHGALCKPHSYLGCTCCTPKQESNSRNSDAAIQPSLPDTSILYKLYLEQGKFINLHDWYITFGCILEDEDKRLLSSSDQRQQSSSDSRRHLRRSASPNTVPKEDDQGLVMARFISAVSELQLLGYINPAGSRRRRGGKKDYVMRMTF